MPGPVPPRRTVTAASPPLNKPKVTALHDKRLPLIVGLNSTVSSWILT